MTEHRELRDNHGGVVTHRRITKYPDTVACTGTMLLLLEPDDYGRPRPVGSDLDHIAVCSQCGSEYAVQTGTGREMRAGQRRDEEAW